MTQVVSNLRVGRRLRALSPLLPAALLPLALAGVTVPRATGLGDAAQELAWARERAVRADTTRVELARLGDLAQVPELEAAAAALRELLPPPRPELEVFNRLRLIGDLVGLGLKQTDLLAPYDLDLAVGGESVQVREARLVGRAPLSRLVEAVHELRRQGLPAAVLELALARASASTPEFDFTLRLGLFHRAPASPAGPGAAGAADPSELPRR